MTGYLGRANTNFSKHYNTFRCLKPPKSKGKIKDYVILLLILIK